MYWIVLLLILIPQVVNAECAWVLWRRIELRPTHPPEEWKVQSATSNEEQCKKRIEEHINKEIDFPDKQVGKGLRVSWTPGVESLVHPIGKHATLGTDVKFITEYTCLPDTVKPNSK